MSKKVQVKVTNIQRKDDKKIESWLKEKFKGEYRNFYTQRDKRYNVSVFFSFKNDFMLKMRLDEFFKDTYWKVEFTEI